MFDVERGTRLTKENRKTGNFPLVTAGEQNLGVKEFISNNDQKIFEKAITIDMFCNSFVHIHHFCCDDNILVLTPKNEMPLKSFYFISSMIGKEKDKFGYGKQYRLNSFNNHKIFLPTKNGKIDFDFMEKMVAELEARHLAELEAYLQCTGLKGYTLTTAEKQALADFENDKIKWGGVKLIDLFESFNGNFDIKKEHINEVGDYVVTAGLGNNGVLGKSDVEAKVFNSNTITVDMFGNAFYRHFKYKMVTHARVFSLSPLFEMTQSQGLFLASSFNFLKYIFGYENMCSWAKIKNTKISLPVKNNKPDYDYMALLISAIQKIVIKDVVLYTNREITLTKQIISKGA